jgi:hypothetical protein
MTKTLTEPYTRGLDREEIRGRRHVFVCFQRLGVGVREEHGEMGRREFRGGGEMGKWGELVPW